MASRRRREGHLGASDEKHREVAAKRLKDAVGLVERGKRHLDAGDCDVAFDLAIAAREAVTAAYAHGHGDGNTMIRANGLSYRVKRECLRSFSSRPMAGR